MIVKNLKTYRIFESEYFDIEENIKDLFLELQQDEGFEVKVDSNFSPQIEDSFRFYYVIIKKQLREEYANMLTDHEREYYGTEFTLRDVMDSIVMCSGYISDNGYEIWDADATTINDRRLKKLDLGYITKLNPENKFQSKEFDIKLTRLRLIIRKRK
jgi:hypothetical protein